MKSIIADNFPRAGSCRLMADLVQRQVLLAVVTRPCDGPAGFPILGNYYVDRRWQIGCLERDAHHAIVLNTSLCDLCFDALS